MRHSRLRVQDRHLGGAFADAPLSEFQSDGFRPEADFRVLDLAARKRTPRRGRGRLANQVVHGLPQRRTLNAIKKSDTAIVPT
jgi:hypothetical protein